MLKYSLLVLGTLSLTTNATANNKLIPIKVNGVEMELQTPWDATIYNIVTPTGFNIMFDINGHQVNKSSNHYFYPSKDCTGEAFISAGYINRDPKSYPLGYTFKQPVFDYPEEVRDTPWGVKIVDRSQFIMLHSKSYFRESSGCEPWSYSSIVYRLKDNAPKITGITSFPLIIEGGRKAIISEVIGEPEED